MNRMCERLVPVPYPLPGYAQIIFRRCDQEATTIDQRSGRFMCAGCAEAAS